MSQMTLYKKTVINASTLFKQDYLSITLALLGEMKHNRLRIIFFVLVTPMRILLAEDDSVLADGLTRSLRQAGYATDCVKNGQEADSVLSTQDFDLLILDLGLPKMTGLEVLRRLRARDSHLPVLILTAADSIEQRVKGLDLGADDYMAKPFALSELEARARPDKARCRWRPDSH